jgi:hypothetical protein
VAGPCPKYVLPCRSAVSQDLGLSAGGRVLTTRWKSEEVVRDEIYEARGRKKPIRKDGSSKKRYQYVTLKDRDRSVTVAGAFPKFAK